MKNQQKLKIKSSQIDLCLIRESNINPQVMKQEDFRRLVKTLKRDGVLTSTVLLFEEAENKYRCISGHHRIKAARIAGIQNIPSMIIYGNVSESVLTRLQLQHNDIHGEPNIELVKQLQGYLNISEKDLVNFIGGDIENLIEEVNVPVFLYQYVNFCLLPETKEEFHQMIEEVQGVDAENYLIEKEDYLKVKDYLTRAFRAGFKSPGQALRKMLTIVNNHKSELVKNDKK